MATRSAAFWIFIVLLVVLHLTLRVVLGLELVPDLLVVAALLGARRLGGAAAAAYGLALGILADAFTITGFGATAVAFVIACYLGSRSRNLFEGDSFLFTLVYVSFGAWLVEAIRFGLEAVRFASAGVEHGEAPISLVTVTPLLALLTGVAGFVALLAYRGITGNR